MRGLRGPRSPSQEKVWRDGPAGHHSHSRGDSQSLGGAGSGNPVSQRAGQRQENLGNHGHRLGYSCDHLCGRVWPLPKGSPSCWRSELSAGAWRITLSLRVCTARGHHPSVRAVHTKENTDSHVRRRVLTADPKELLLQRCPWWSGS